MGNQHIVTEVINSIVEVRIDRAQKHNAMTLAMWNALSDTLVALDQDPFVRVVLISGGQTSKHFCAGADISEFETERKDAATARKYENANIRAFASVRNCSKPTIALINGYCIGGGFGIAAACDMRFATPDATFGVPAARLGLAYPVNAMADIVAAIGEQKTKELIYTAKRINAEQALAAGFLTAILEPDQLTAHCIDLANQIAENAPLSISAAKAAIKAARSGKTKDIEEAMALGDDTFESDDYAQGRAAFLEKRKAIFNGK